MHAAPADSCPSPVPVDPPRRASAAAKLVRQTRPVPLPSLSAIRLVLAPALVFIATSLDRGYQTELWQHLARGRLIAAEHTIVSTDGFTFTIPNQPFRDNNWLWQLAHHALFTLGGLPLVQCTNSLVLAAAVALLVRLCHRQSGSTRVAGALGAVAFLGLWQTLLIRPQSVSMLLFVSLYTLLHAAERRPRLLLLAPPVIALWVNVHGGFAIGLALIGTFTLPAVLRRTSPLPWVACLLASALATLLNPYGPDVYRYAGQLSALGVARGIEEWLPPSPVSLVGATFVLSVAAVAALAWRARQRITLRDVCLLVVFAVPACFSVRMTVWWFLAAAPVAARLVVAGTEAPAPDRNCLPSWRAAVALAAILAVCVLSLPWLEAVSPLARLAPRARRPEADLAALLPALTQSSRDPRVFSRMEWSNYLAWATGGRAKVFVEGHVELYGDAVWSDFTAVNDARPGWRQVLDRYGVNCLVLDPTYHARLLSELRKTNEWRQRAASGRAVLFERTPAAEKE